MKRLLSEPVIDTGGYLRNYLTKTAKYSSVNITKHIINGRFLDLIRNLS